MLVVMSTADNTGSGLVLAASPMAKKVLGISNVMRARDVPNHKDLLIVPPRMKFYIEENMKINKIYRSVVADEDLHIYSIDESILDVTASLNLFVPDPTLSRSQKRWRLARMIQLKVKKETGLYVTVGIGDNPLLAKLALDNESKHNRELIAEFTYENVEEKVWSIPELTDFWGIGSRTAAALEEMDIHSIRDLANIEYSTLLKLKKKYGIIGVQLYHHANGIDRSILSKPYRVLEKSYGNSQVLDRDYVWQHEIETVISEMADQVATRIRRHGCQTSCINLWVGPSMSEAVKGFSKQMKIPTTDSTKKLTEHCIELFRRNWTGYNVRHIGITYKNLIYNDNRQLDLFSSAEDQDRQIRLDQIVDRIRGQYGFTKLIHATSLTPGARSLVALIW